jgi:hypothetical protein
VARRGPLTRITPGPGNAALRVDDLILAFWTRHAEKHFRRADGTPAGELSNYRDTLKPDRRLSWAKWVVEIRLIFGRLLRVRPPQ